MAIAQPVGSDTLSAGNHVDMHRIIACDVTAPVKSIAVNSDGTVDVVQLAAGGHVNADVTTGRLTIATSKYGGMFLEEGSVALNILDANVYHAAYGSESGQLSGVTFIAGYSRTISSVEENEAGVSIKVNTSTDHGLATGDAVSFHSTTDYNGVKAVLSAPSSTQIIVAGTYGVTRTGTLLRPDYLKISAGAAGTYLCNLALTADASGNNKLFKMKIFINAVEARNIVMEDFFQTQSAYKQMSTSGILILAENDRVWMGVMNKTDTTDITFRHGNVNICRIS